MPTRRPPVTDHASRILMEGIVDYAGVYPPAALDMAVAVRHYAHYRAGGAGWMLGRFVCPASALATFSQLADPLLPRDAGAIPWRLSVTASGDIPADLDRMAAFNERHRVCFEECGAIVDAYDVRVSSAAELASVNAAIPQELVTYLEVPFAHALDLLPRIAATGRRAKMRTGGVVADAFPSTDSIIAFLQTCIAHNITAKATAGLHHALRGAYRLTYDAAAPTGSMFGYVNVFLAAALLANGEDAALAAQLLEESDPTTLSIDEVQVSWRSATGIITLDRALLQRVRETLLVSFGSCSFTEPVDDLKSLGWM